jgi:Domain of unknown function (DUF4062)
VTTIYLSSTYSDLKACRETVYHVLRHMRLDVIAMEDYVASDQRPLDKCLHDVEQCDLYIGIFAWRYGYIPPEGKAITELEYRKALETGKPRLIFLLHEEAAWPLNATDMHSGKGNEGALIKNLRQELQQSELVSFFRTAEDLAALVGQAVHNWEIEYSIKDQSFPQSVARKRYLENLCNRYGSVSLPIGSAEGFSLHAIFQPLALRSEPLTAEDLERGERRALLGEASDKSARILSELHMSQLDDMQPTPKTKIIVESIDPNLLFPQLLEEQRPDEEPQASRPLIAESGDEL